MDKNNHIFDKNQPPPIKQQRNLTEKNKQTEFLLEQMVIITPWGLCPFNDMAITHDHILLSFGIKMFQPARLNLCLGSDK